jgi:hypothetical protein
MSFSKLHLKFANDIYSTISSGSGTSILLFQGDAGLKGPVGAQGDMGAKVCVPLIIIIITTVIIIIIIIIIMETGFIANN